MGEETDVQAASPQAQLFAAMAKVLGEVSRVRKNGRNDFHRYSYVQEADLVDAVRHHMSENGLSFWPSVVNDETEEIKSAKGKTEYRVTVYMEITFAHSGGGTKTTRWVGQGVDSSDKAFYKAYTGAVKYALMKTFMVSTGDDPEQETRQPEPRTRRRERQIEREPRRAAPAKPPSETAGERLGRLEKACREAAPDLTDAFLTRWATALRDKGDYDGPVNLTSACMVVEEANKLVRSVESKTVEQRAAMMRKMLAEKASEEAA